MDVVGDVVATVRTGMPHSSRTTQPDGWRIWFPPSTSVGFHAVLHGRAWLHPPTGPPLELTRGDVVFLPQGLGHGLAAGRAAPPAGGQPWRPEIRFGSPDPASRPRRALHGPPELLCAAYELDPRRAHPLLDDLPAVVHTSTGRDKGLEAAIMLLADELGARRPGGEAAVTSALDLALVHLVRLGLERSDRRHPARTAWAEALNDPVVGAALLAIHSQPATTWTVRSLGRLGGASRSTFAQRFTQLTGQPPLRYLTWWRLTCAARLLDEGDPDLTIAEIAHKTGYRSEHAFAKAFKRHHGSAPGRYRRRRQLPPGPARTSPGE